MDRENARLQASGDPGIRRRALDALTRGSELREPELEHAYRRFRLSASRPGALVLFATVSIPVVVFVASDLQLFGLAPAFQWLLAARGGFLVATAVIMVVTLRSRSPAVVEGMAIAWWALLLTFLALVNMTRPSRYFGNASIDVLVVLSAYIALPVRWSHQLVAGLSATLVSVGTFIALRDVSSPLLWNATIVGHVVVNLLGAAASGRLHRSDRQLFAAFKDDRASRVLISTLWNIIPMCCGCKKVRDSNGQWHEVERYITSKTGADISHGLCPGCLETLYPEHSASAKRRARRIAGEETATPRRTIIRR